MPRGCRSLSLSILAFTAAQLAKPAQSAQPPAASTQPPAASTTQQQFDAASDAVVAGECAKALPMFEALERKPAIKPGSLSAAAIAVRKGNCLIWTGRTAEGEAAILAGLPRLEQAGADFASDVAESYFRLGDAALNRWDYGLARQRYQKALSLQPAAGLKVMILAGLTKATAFDPGPEGLRYADEAIREASAVPKLPKDLLADLHTLKARILLNQGQTEQAYAVLNKALVLSGGLTSRTTLNEASMRGDLALAAMLLGKTNEARKYLAYTGAGRIVESTFGSAAAMEPPECGEDTGLRPKDFAVVEFGIADVGSVWSVQTVYSRGGPKVAAAFAQAVSQWYWEPAALAKIPAFYRVATRVELRCSAAGGESPGTIKPLTDRFATWAAAQLGARGTATAEPIDWFRRELETRERSGDAAGQVAATGLLEQFDPRTNAETLARLDRAIALGGRPGVPGEAINALRILRLVSTPNARVAGRSYYVPRLGNAKLLALAGDPAIAADPLARATLLLLATNTPPAQLQQIADEERLGANHPLRQVALLRLANSAAASGDLASAQKYFARTGLTEQQCALIGATPTMRRTGASPNDFPQEAMAWGFEGWVHLESDIGANGRTANIRPLIAYPPFVFVDAAKDVASGIIYTASYRPSGGTACSANRQTIRFVLPFR